MSPLAGCRSDALGSSRGPFPVRMAETSGATSRRVETSARAYPTWSAYPSASQAAGRPGTVDRTATWASSCVSTTSRPLGVSRPNAVGSSTTRSPVAVPADPVGPSVVAATGAAPDPAGRPRSASASDVVAGASTRTRAGVPVHCSRSGGTARSTTAACSASRAVGTVPATTACSPRRTRSVGIATHGAVAPAPTGRSASTCQPAPERTRSYSSRATRSPRSRSSTR